MEMAITYLELIGSLGSTLSSFSELGEGTLSTRGTFVDLSTTLGCVMLV